MPESLGPQFLKEKYDLHREPEVEAAVDRYEQRTGEQVPGNKAALQISTFLDRLEKVFEPPTPEGHPNFDRRERNLNLLKPALYNRFVIKPRDIPERAFALEQQAARELGYGDVAITNEFRRKKTEEIIDDQETSLDRWLDYLTSPDADYPVWAKYWAFRSVLSMGSLVKEEDRQGHEVARFQNRRKDTVSPFPVLNPGALALTIGAVVSSRERKSLPKIDRTPVANTSERLNDQEWQQLVSTENFATLYTQFLLEQPEYSTEGLQNIKGRWVVYPRHSDPTPLVESIADYPLEWCTRNPGTAASQLSGGDFYVYYSENEQGKNVIPRVAIRMQGNKIAEVRGIAPGQQIDPYIAPVIQAKMAEFPDGKEYEKKATDMRRLTTIERKVQARQSLGRDDLVFLYEMEGTIEGFAIDDKRDPRIKELRDQRDPYEDAPIVFDCQPDQIAWGDRTKLSQNTTVYIGEWNMEVFQRVKNYPRIEHFYESFPDKKIFMQSLETHPSISSAEVAEQALIQKNDYISGWGKGILEKTKFSKESQKYDLVRFTVAQLGYPNGATTDEIYTRAEELGLELCPAEVGPHLRLQYRGNEWMMIAMKQITDRFGYPSVFHLGTNGLQLVLGGSDADPSHRWYADNRFVFCFRKISQEA